MDAIKEKFVNMYIDSLSDEEQDSGIKVHQADAV